jgi:hypothetical protein
MPLTVITGSEIVGAPSNEAGTAKPGLSIGVQISTPKHILLWINVRICFSWAHSAPSFLNGGLHGAEPFPRRNLVANV